FSFTSFTSFLSSTSFSILSRASDIVVSPRCPSKSILMRPRASIAFISYCVTTMPLAPLERAARMDAQMARRIVQPQGHLQNRFPGFVVDGQVAALRQILDGVEDFAH